MKIDGLPPELDEVLDRINARTTAGGGPDAITTDAEVLSDVSPEVVCRAQMSGEFDPVMTEGVLLMVREAAQWAHQVGHEVGCGQHIGSLQTAMTGLFMAGWFLRGDQP